MEDSEADFADYFPASRRDPNQMWAELGEIVSQMRNPHLKVLLGEFLADEEIAGRFRMAPAAKQIHHAFLGGLLEHVLSLCTLARFAAGHYPFVDFDLLLAGIVLHDIGKIQELNYQRGFSYSDDGQLLGHIVIALRMLSEKVRALPDFPERLRSLIEHMIISHHGHLEFGSPKLPQFPEALLLHYLDDMDSKMECMRALLDRDQMAEGCFTGYSTAMERTVLKKAKYLDEVGALKGGTEAEPPVRAPAATPEQAAHPLFAASAPKSGSVFGDKLLEALRPAESKQQG